VRGAARLDADQARRQLGKEPQHLRTSKRPADNDLTRRINPVNLKNALGQIEADRGNLHGGWLPFCS
jgi:type VI protein secretion system component VasK